MRTRTFPRLLLLAGFAAGAAAQELPAPLDEVTGTALSLSPAQQQARWAQMSAAQREELRARYRAWRALDEASRAEIRRAQAQVTALPLEQQQALRTQFAAMDRLHRDGWRLGPTLGARYPQLQPLFGYVPAAQREIVLGLLRSLDAEQLEQLSMLSQRTPPQDRDALREELLAQAPAARAAWLRRKLGR